MGSCPITEFRQSHGCSLARNGGHRRTATTWPLRLRRLAPPNGAIRLNGNEQMTTKGSVTLVPDQARNGRA
jgi:hypothetical protein